jgi:hypothetical protein
MYSLSSNIDTLGYKVFDRAEQKSKIDLFISLLKEPEIQSFLKVCVEGIIATSDLKILKRLSKVEASLGLLDECFIEEEDKASNLPARLEILEDKVNTFNSSFEPALEPPIKLTTKTQRRACALVNKLRQCKKRFLTSSEIIDFLRHEAPDDIRITEDIRNPREIKKEVIEKAAELFSDIQLSKKSHGRREVRILIS